MIATDLAGKYGGIVARALLLGAGVTKDEIDAELAARRWQAVGPNTIAILQAPLPAWSAGGGPKHAHMATTPVTYESKSSPASLWWAIWESGTGAVLDGASSLTASGLSGFTLPFIDVSVEAGSRIWRHPGIRVKQRRPVGALAPGGIPRVEAAMATIRAAQLAVSDRQAALVICMAVQQGIVRPAKLQQRWREILRSKRRHLIGPVIADVCDGAHSLGELDFAGLCRARNLPEPVRQKVCRGPKGRVYLDAEFACGLVVEIDGAQRGWGLASVDDALRANHVTLQNRRVLRIPVIGLRVSPDAFMRQVELGIQQSSPR